MIGVVAFKLMPLVSYEYMYVCQQYFVFKEILTKFTGSALTISAHEGSCVPNVHVQPRVSSVLCLVS